MGHIDWSRTQAYALGLNQLFVNLVGREPDGTVPPAEREVVLKRLERALMRWRDPETGARVVSKITRPNAEAFPDRAPDFIVGFAHGYRSSDTSAVGLVTGGGTIEVNRDKWSGDHCMDARVVPGILFTSWTIPKDKSAALGLADMAPTILDAFGVAPADAMKGRSVWKGQFENAINGE